MAVTKQQVKAIARKHVRAALAKSGVNVGAQVVPGVNASGVPQYTLQTYTGDIVPDDSAVDAQAEMLAAVIMDLLPLLTVETTVVVDTGSGHAQGKGHGTVS